MSQVKNTFCRICEPACGLLADIDDHGKVAGLRPNPDYPLGGRPCNKGISFLDVHNDPDRLNWPMRRKVSSPRNAHGQKAEFERISWDQAMTEAAARIHELQEKYGSDALAFYAGNPASFDARAMATVYYLAPFLNTKMVFTAGTQDCNNKVFLCRAMYGGNCYFIPDLYHTDYFLCLGANPKASHWTFVQVPNDGGQILKDTRGAL